MVIVHTHSNNNNTSARQQQTVPHIYIVEYDVLMGEPHGHLAWGTVFRHWPNLACPHSPKCIKCTFYSHVGWAARARARTYTINHSPSSVSGTAHRTCAKYQNHESYNSTSEHTTTQKKNANEHSVAHATQQQQQQRQKIQHTRRTESRFAR